MSNPYVTPLTPVAPAKPVEIVAILDRSGSMCSILTDAIGGFNQFLAEQKALPGEALLTMVLFDDKYEVPVAAYPVTHVNPLTPATFSPRGMTALYDAVGRALTELEHRNPERAVVVILTDGHENASREYTQPTVKAKITAAEARGWSVLYLAANQDAFAVGGAIGVKAGNTANFANTGAGVRSAYATATTATASYRAGGSAAINTGPDLSTVGVVDPYVAVAPQIFDPGAICGTAAPSDSGSSSDASSSDCSGSYGGSD